jgi:hypothetical protein
MDTKEIKERRNNRNEKLQQQFSVLNDNSLMPEEKRKYELLRQFRIKLGKSKKGFQKIFKLFNHLVDKKNA